MTAPDIRDLDRRAVLASVEVVNRATATDLALPTPCAGWTLRDLLEHMTVQHHGFAAAAAGGGQELALWAPVPLADPVSAHAAAAEQLLAAFAVDGVLERSFALPELAATAFAGARAIGFHFIDAVVHGWDVAAALGIGYDLDPELAGPALRIAERVDDGPRRQQPGAAFRPSLAGAAEASGLDRILALLGRSPSWPA